MAITQRKKIGILFVLTCLFLCETSPTWGFALTSTKGSGFAWASEYYSWGDGEDIITIKYAFDSTFFKDPDPLQPTNRFKDQVRLAFDQWAKTGFGNQGTNIDSYLRKSSQPFGDLRSLALHEIGHLLGLDHPDEAQHLGLNFHYKGPWLSKGVAATDKEVMKSQLQPGNYNHILSNDELQGYHYIYAPRHLVFEEAGPGEKPDIWIGTFPLEDKFWAEAKITDSEPRGSSDGRRIKAGRILFNSKPTGYRLTPDSQGNPIGFMMKSINWDYENKSNKRVASFEILTRGTDNPDPFSHFDGFSGKEYKYEGAYGWMKKDPLSTSGPDKDTKDDLIHRWHWQGLSAAAPTLPHFGLNQDVYDWWVVSATANFTNGTSDDATPFLTPDSWQHTTTVTPTTSAFTPSGAQSVHKPTVMGQYMVAEVVEARGFRVVAPALDITSEIKVLGMANVQGDNLTLAQLNRITRQQLMFEGRFIDLTPYIPTSQRFLGYQDELFVVLDGDVPDLPQEIVDAGNYLIYTAPELLDGELYVFVESESNTSVVGTHALLGEQFEGSPGLVEEYVVVDDFEGYNDDTNRIFDTWIDGWGSSTNGSMVGYPRPDFAAGEHFVEIWIIHGGGQSMPFFYDNHQRYSEATRTLSHPRDWTEEGSAVLSLWFYGNTSNVLEQMYVALDDGAGASAVVYHNDPNAVLTEVWTEWNVDLQIVTDQGVDLTDIDRISIGFGDKDNPQPGGSGLMYFDDIRLIRRREEVLSE